MEYFLQFFCGLLGVVFNVFTNIHQLKKLYKAANLPFRPVKDFLLIDIYNIAASLVAVLILMVIYPEISAKLSFLSIVPRLTFVITGFGGSEILLRLFSKAGKAALEQIDHKTDLLDGIITGVEETKAQFFPTLVNLDDSVLSIDGSVLQVAIPVRNLPLLSRRYFIVNKTQLHATGSQKIKLRVSPINGGPEYDVESILVNN